eukprot:193063-Pelagomonas_calceolata.AAC.1
MSSVLLLMQSTAVFTSVVETKGEGHCAPRIVFHSNGWASKPKIELVLLQDSCLSALQELVPLFNGIYLFGKPISVSEVIPRTRCDWEGIGNSWDNGSSNHIHCLPRCGKRASCVLKLIGKLVRHFSKLGFPVQGFCLIHRYCTITVTEAGSTLWTSIEGGTEG